MNFKLEFAYLNPFDGKASFDAAELGESENELPFRKRAESVQFTPFRSFVGMDIGREVPFFKLA